MLPGRHDAVFTVSSVESKVFFDSSKAQVAQQDTITLIVVLYRQHNDLTFWVSAGVYTTLTYPLPPCLSLCVRVRVDPANDQNTDMQLGAVKPAHLSF